MNLKKIFVVIVLLNAFFRVHAENSWSYIGKTDKGWRIFATSADSQSDGSWRAYMKAEIQMERQPTGVFSIFKRAEKYTETSDPTGVLINCKRKSVREYKSGPLGSEFHIPWEPVIPGTPGDLMFQAFCKR